MDELRSNSPFNGKIISLSKWKKSDFPVISSIYVRNHGVHFETQNLLVIFGGRKWLIREGAVLMWRFRRGFGKKTRNLKWVWLIIRKVARIDGRKSRRRLEQNRRRRLKVTTSCCWMMWRRSRLGRLRSQLMQIRISQKALTRRRSKSGCREKLQDRGLKTNIGYLYMD